MFEEASEFDDEAPMVPEKYTTIPPNCKVCGKRMGGIIEGLKECDFWCVRCAYPIPSEFMVREYVRQGIVPFPCYLEKKWNQEIESKNKSQTDKLND